MGKDLNAYITKDTLNISVDNLGELKNIIEEIQIKESELSRAVERLRLFKLRIKFEDKF